MKRIILLVAFASLAVTAKAQSCDSVVLPYFDNDIEAYNSCPVEKVNYLCAFAKAAFYESDTVPTGADTYDIGLVQNRFTGENLSSDFVYEEGKISYFAYTFDTFQLKYPKVDKVLCFSTPSSEHAYLVLRSIGEMTDCADKADAEQELKEQNEKQ